jgi:lactate dehydrogenase-like 2-hydroxyacid dehydrogenase
MQRKLTISIDARIYDGLHAVIGRGRIGKFLEDLARPFVSRVELAEAYREMAADKDRDLAAEEWSEALIGDAAGAPR